jgi:nitroreductase
MDLGLDAFYRLASKRRSVRSFLPKPVSKDQIYRLLDCAHWAPSGFNLQPTHYYVTDDQKKKEKLYKACLKQRQVLEAPVVIAFTGDRRVIEHNADLIIDQEYEEGTMNEEYEEKLRAYLSFNFGTSPIGFGWLVKALVAPILRLFTPMPSFPAVHKRYWLTKQVMLSCMNFLLAAEAAGLATSPIEGFDEWRVRHHLGIPLTHIVPLLICVGHGAQEQPKKTRLDIQDLVHWS